MSYYSLNKCTWILIYSLSCSASFLAPKYKIMDASDNTIFCIEGPMCMCQGPCCTQDMDFNVCTMYEKE